MAKSGPATLEPALRQASRPILADLDLPPGKRVRLHRLLYETGLRNGTLLVLPIDQGIEHGPLNFFENPAAKDPEFQWQLAVNGGYNAIACHWGLARMYMAKYAGKIGLILKINGKTNVPSDDDAFSPMTASVDDAISIGADAVGYTLYVGSPKQAEDIAQLTRVRLAHELGADIIKLNVPKRSDKDPQAPKPYDKLEWEYEDGVRRVVESAGRSLVLFSGGSKIGDDDLIDKARVTMEQGATGLIFGRNMWQRPLEQALALTDRIKDLLRKFPG